MKISSTLHVLVFCMAGLTFSIPFIVLSQEDSGRPEAKTTRAVLLIGDYQGIDETDAQSAALLVALELRKQGISVSNPVYEAHASASVYKISFRRLGGKVLAHLTQETPIGTIIIERQLWIANIEEMVEAAPRLVEALVHKKSIASTVDIESVVQDDAPVLRKISGESLWNVGLFGASVPGTNFNGELGFGAGLSYQMPTYAVETEFRITGGASENDNFIFGTWSIGGRYFFNKQNISPYVGGGLALAAVNYEMGIEREYDLFWQESYSDSESEGDTGMGVYVIGGIEMLRLSRNRLKLELRIDRTLFRLPTQDVMPITLGIFFSSNHILGDFGLF